MSLSILGLDRQVFYLKEPDGSGEFLTLYSWVPGFRLIWALASRFPVGPGVRIASRWLPSGPAKALCCVVSPNIFPQRGQNLKQNL